MPSKQDNVSVSESKSLRLGTLIIRRIETVSASDSRSVQINKFNQNRSDSASVSDSHIVAIETFAELITEVSSEKVFLAEILLGDCVTGTNYQWTSFSWISIDATLASETDPGGEITIDSSSLVSWVNLTSDSYESFVRNDMGSFLFSGDFSIRFILNANVSGTIGMAEYAAFVLAKKGTGIVGMMAGSSEDDDFIAIDIFYDYSTSEVSVTLFICEDGYEINATSKVISQGVDYYVHLVRDDDAGSNGTGQITMYLSTGGYYGDGGTLIDTQTLDCSAGEQNDYRYIYWVNSYVDGLLTRKWIGNASDLKYMLQIV